MQVTEIFWGCFAPPKHPLVYGHGLWPITRKLLESARKFTAYRRRICKKYWITAIGWNTTKLPKCENLPEEKDKKATLHLMHDIFIYSIETGPLVHATNVLYFPCLSFLNMLKEYYIYWEQLATIHVASIHTCRCVVWSRDSNKSTSYNFLVDVRSGLTTR